MVTLFILVVAPPASATFPGRNGLIAYTGTADGQSTDIFTVDPVSGAVTRLTTAAGNDSSPAWSPDGKKIAFASERDGPHPQIYVMNADGSHQTRLTTAGGDQPAWSPDGRQIVFSNNDSDDSAIHLFVMNSNGTDVRQLTTGAGDDFAPDWSPDGNTIAFSSDRCCSISDLWLLHVADGSIEHFEGLSPDGTFDPKWAPDSEKISFSFANNSLQPLLQLAWVDVDAIPTTGFDAKLNGEQGAFSPDGSTYTYTHSGAIYVNGSSVALATSTEPDAEPDWGVAPRQVQCEVPRLSGRTLAAGRTMLHRRHCRLGRVTRKYSSRHRRGRIMGESPHAGAARPEDAAVAVVVSRGPRRNDG